MSFCNIPPNLKKLGDAAGVDVEKDINGMYRIYTKASRAFVAAMDSEVNAREYIKNLINQNAPNLNPASQIPMNGVPLSTRLPKVNDVLNAFREGVKNVQVGASVFTPIKQFAQHLEDRGLGKAWSYVYKQSQFLKGLADDAVARTKRANLGNKTFQEAIRDFEKKVLELDKDMRVNTTLYAEAFTKPELENLLRMNPNELKISRFFQAIKQEHNIPSLIRRNAIIDDFLAHRVTFLNQDLPRLVNAIKEKRLPPELMQQVEALRLSAGNETTWQEVAQTMRITQDEMQAMGALRVLASEKGRANFNLVNVYRHATALELDPKYRTGRDQFAARTKMSKEAIALAEERMKILEEGFKDLAPGFSSELTMGIHLPVFRQFIDVGLLPGKQFAKSSGAARQWADLLNVGAPQSSDILSRRVLSGHLNPHELDPAISMSKHIRNLALRNTLDPEMKNLLQEVSNIDNASRAVGETESRFGRIMYNYLHEIQGHPTEGMEDLAKYIQSIGRFTGRGFDERVAEKLVDTLGYLTYSASIPFRAALVMRNFYQITMSLPIIGPEAWVRGIKVVLEDSDNAWKRAMDAQALTPDTVPLYGSGEGFSEIGSIATKRLPKAISNIGFNVREAFQWAFRQYRRADDVGRVIQFEAGRLRASEYIGTFMKSARTDADMQVLLEGAKVKTFHETVEREFVSLIKLGQQDAAASLIGKELSDKVHFLYGRANHPIGWGGPVGKLMGQFGTFPVQYVNHIAEGVSRGTIGDKAGFIVGHTGINMGIVAAGAAAGGVDLEGWAFYPAMQYTGGPYAEMTLSAIAAWGGSDAEKALAKRNLSMMMPWHIPSITLPGSYFLSDWARAYNEQDTFGRFLAQAGGFRFRDQSDPLFPWVEKGFGWVGEIGD